MIVAIARSLLEALGAYELYLFCFAVCFSISLLFTFVFCAMFMVGCPVLCYALPPPFPQSALLLLLNSASDLHIHL